MCACDTICSKKKVDMSLNVYGSSKIGLTTIQVVRNVFFFLQISSFISSVNRIEFANDPSEFADST